MTKTCKASHTASYTRPGELTFVAAASFMRSMSSEVSLDRLKTQGRPVEKEVNENTRTPGITHQFCCRKS